MATPWLHWGYTGSVSPAWNDPFIAMPRAKKTDALDLSQPVNLTVDRIERLTCCTDLKAQAFLRDTEAPGLRVRVTNTGAKAFVFEGKLQRHTIRRTIGSVQAWSIKEARAEARRLAVMLDSGLDPREVAQAKRAAREQAKLVHQRALEFTLGALAMDYADQLEKMGRSSHAKVRGLLRLHLLLGHAALASTPACRVTGEEVTDLLRALTQVGKQRTAGKLRAYLRSAFEMARTAGLDATLPVRFKAYGIKHNPVSDTKAIQSEAAKAPLSAQELRQYWQAIKGQETFEGAVLRLHLLTGGQRLEQLCRLREGDTRPAEIVLFDGKGRPGKKPRAHPLPLTPGAAEALNQAMLWAPRRQRRSSRGRLSALDDGTSTSIGTKNASAASSMSHTIGGAFVLSTDNGQTPVSANALAKWSKKAGAEIHGFSAKRIRSGVETALASMRVSKEDRGHLLSHGVGGVQANSYDGHDYMVVKLSSLQALQRFLEAQEADVIPLFAEQA